MQQQQLEQGDQPIFRWGFLSTANIGRKNRKAVQRTGNQAVVAVASRRAEAAQAFAEEEGIARALGSYEELLADPAVDAVYIPLPTGLHPEWAIRCAEVSSLTATVAAAGCSSGNRPWSVVWPCDICTPPMRRFTGASPRHQFLPPLPALLDWFLGCGGVGPPPFTRGAHPVLAPYSMGVFLGPSRRLASTCSARSLWRPTWRGHSASSRPFATAA